MDLPNRATTVGVYHCNLVLSSFKQNSFIQSELPAPKMVFSDAMWFVMKRIQLVVSLHRGRRDAAQLYLQVCSRPGVKSSQTAFAAIPLFDPSVGTDYVQNN
jgi:hypothetical protein